MGDKKWHISLGITGEEIACKYLKDRGYIILDRNFREKFGEIDIVTKSGDGILVFFEVKTMKLGFGVLDPEDNFTRFKFIKFSKTCRMFVDKHPELINKKGWQINLITIRVPELLTNDYKDCVINVYENISFDLDNS